VEFPLEFFFLLHHVVPCPEEALPLLEQAQQGLTCLAEHGF
jgi:hypothetical protein